MRLPGPELYRAFLDNDRSGILFAAADGALVEANAAACRVLSVEREELIGRPVHDLFPPGFRDVLEGDSFRGELPVRRGGDGDGVPTAVTLARYGEPGAPGGFVVALRALDEPPPALGSEQGGIDTWLTDLAADAVVVFDEGGAIKYANRSLETLLGYEPGEMIGVVALHVVHPSDLQRMVGEFAEAWETPGVGRPIAFRARHSDGHYVHCETTTNNLLDDPRVGGVVVVFRDVGERVAELRSTTERFNVAFERSGVGMGEIAAHGTWLRVNPRLAEMLGRDASTMSGQPALDVVHPEDRPAAQAHLRPTEHTEHQIEQRWLRADGTPVWVAVAAGRAEAPPGAEPGEVTVVVVDDIDQRRRGEAALATLTARELEVLELVAAGATNRAIAERLVLSPRTAKFHVENVIRKLGVPGRREVADRAAELGISP